MPTDLLKRTEAVRDLGGWGIRSHPQQYDKSVISLKSVPNLLAPVGAYLAVETLTISPYSGGPKAPQYKVRLLGFNCQVGPHRS